MQTFTSRCATRAFILPLLFALLMTACGGGGGGTATTPPTAGTSAPSALSYPTPQAFTIGQAVATVKPSVTGTVASYTVSPALPAGLTFGSTDGSISGTPTVLAAQAGYTVTATNSGGSTTAVVTIAVNDLAPVISYPGPTVALATGVPIATLSPSQASGGPPVSWSVTPALPAGLSFSTADGSIKGMPTADAASATYTVSATNSGGTGTFSLALSVQSGVLLDLGHADAISTLRFDGTRVLSADVTGHWILWNYTSGAKIVSGDSGCSAPSSGNTCGNPTLADMAGPAFAIETATGFEMRSSTDGHVTGTVTTSMNRSWWMLAADGSYLIAANAAGGFQVWSTTGTSLLTKATPVYLPGTVFAAPGAVLAAIKSGATNVIETTSTSTGMSANSAPFNGTFKAWFADGSSFLTAASTDTVLTYSAAALQQGATTVASIGALTGDGTWFVNYQNQTLSVYKVGASTTAAASYAMNTSNPALFTPSGSLYIQQGGVLSFVDLSGVTPVKVDQPLIPTTQGVTFAALSPTQWVSGSFYGVLFDGASGTSTPRYLNMGRALSIDGSATRFAVATASGRVLHFDSATRSPEGTIQKFSKKVLLSTDGTVMAALGDGSGATASADTATVVYSLPGEAVLSTWPTGNSTPAATNIGLSSNGAVLGQTFSDGTAAANPVLGGAAILNTAGPCAALRLSSDGSNIACPAVRGPSGNDPAATTATKLFNNGALTSALSNGLALSWLDDGHLLVADYKRSDLTAYIPDGASVYDASGTFLSKSGLPALPFFSELHEVQTLTADTIYAREYNSIQTVSTGATTWISADSSRGVGAVAGTTVIFASGAQVLALTH